VLKNEKRVLPLNKNIRSITVIGPDATEARLGGYSGPGNGKINILDGIKEKLGSTANVIYSEGVGRKNSLWQTIPSSYLSTMQEGKKIPGLKGEYYNGLTPGDKLAVTRTDAQVDFNWTLYPPDSSLSADNYSVRWTGQLQSPGTGSFKIGLDGNDGYRLYINNVLLIDNWRKQTYSTRLVDYDFKKDSLYALRVEFYEPSGNAHIRLIWNMGVINDDALKIKNAVESAQQSDATIIVAGIEEGEFRDRAMLNLPGSQEILIQSIAATGKPVIVLLVGGSAITMNNWLDKVNAVVTLWYPGEEGGYAVADILFGDANPAGRLPITFPLSEAQLPLVYNHKPTGRGDDYNNLSGLPLFPFGFGLSYTQFAYSNIYLDKKQIHTNESAQVFCTITNTGKREGDEVVQLYIRDMLASVARPVLELKGFQRIRLAAGESRQINFMITPEMLQMLNQKMQTVVELGDFRIMIGSSCRDLWLKENLRVQ
jgi:beta-glucosidase